MAISFPSGAVDSKELLWRISRETLKQETVLRLIKSKLLAEIAGREGRRQAIVRTVWHVLETWST